MNGNEQGEIKNLSFEVIVQLKVIINKTAETTIEDAIIELCTLNAQKVE